MNELREKAARVRKPNWMAALCGAAYLFCFLVFPVYNYSQMSFEGAKLVPAAPLSWLMLLCGAAMMVCPLMIKRKAGLWVGFACVVITALSGLLGDLVLGAASTMKKLSIHLNYSGFRVHHTAVSVGYVLCLVCSALFCLMEWQADWLHPKHKRFLDKHGNQIYRDRNGKDMSVGV